MKRRLHLFRSAAEAPPVLDERDWVVYLPTMRLAGVGAPPHPPGSITHEQLVDLIFAADLVITW